MPRRSLSPGVLAAFAVIYVFWGATFLAIRIGDATLPPLAFAALRFIPAGLLLYGWGWLRGGPHPSAPEWRSIVLVALLMFPVGYGLQFWAQTRVSSGLTAVIVTLVPLWVAAIEIWVFRTTAPSVKVIGGCVLGLAGMAVLMSGGAAGARLPLLPVLALLAVSLSWSVATILIARLPLPRSTGISAGAQMLVGGLMLAAGAAATGEFHGVDWLHALTPAALWSLLYLIVAGSVVAYAAYVWLLGRVSAVRVATFALVNPIVALLLGWAWAGEVLTAASLAGTAIILAALALVLSRPPPKAATISA
ncbi:MAG: EamA family transporter [Terriglobales bacterium]